MSRLNDIGHLMHLYLNEIDPGDGTYKSSFLIKATADLLRNQNQRNWIPVIVKETQQDKYEVIGNAFIYAVAAEAGLERVWCIVADESDSTKEIVQVLAQEKLPKVNLSSASRDEILLALEFLVQQPGSLLKTVKVSVAANRIDEAPRQYWKNLDPIVSLKCGITKGKKLDALKQVFYLTPQPVPEMVTDIGLLNSFSLSELKSIAKKRGFSGLNRIKKDELVRLLSQLR